MDLILMESTYLRWRLWRRKGADKCESTETRKRHRHKKISPKKIRLKREKSPESGQRLPEKVFVKEEPEHDDYVDVKPCKLSPDAAAKIHSGIQEMEMNKFDDCVQFTPADPLEGGFAMENIKIEYSPD